MVNSHTKRHLGKRTVGIVVSLLMAWSILTSPVSQPLQHLDRTHLVADGGSLPPPGSG